jgi:phosphoribosylformimino-5-aminoimidazole carboxamide ribotide isomerase
VRVIPVIDILGGKAVHAVRGEREKYEPLKSVLTRSQDPLSVAVAFKKMGLREVYIADLDAITLGKRRPELVARIVKSGMDLIVDAGFSRAEDVKAYVEKGVEGIVLATETLGGWEEVSNVVKDYGMRVVASIDMKSGKLVAKSAEMILPVGQLVEKFGAEGASEVLLLGLDRVGTSRGPDYGLLDEALKHTKLPLLVGGGVKNMMDVYNLKKRGASGVLVATALHKGTITEKDLGGLRV